LKTSIRVLLVVLSLLATTTAVPANTLVQFDFGSRGVVLVDLFDNVAPNCVDQFLGYVGGGLYTDTIIHRSTQFSNFGLIQGGGFNSQQQNVTQQTNFPNEYHLNNQRGTLGSARLPDPTSFSSQWFFNTTDNSTTLSPPNNGGYAVFGWIVGGGISTIDAIHDLPTFAFTQPFAELPLDDYSQQDFDNDVSPLGHFAMLNGITIVETHPSFQNPVNPGDVNNDGQVTLQDQLLVQNYLLANGPTNVNAIIVGTSYLYLDVNGDGQISAIDVPEPSAMLLAGIGLAALCHQARRRGSPRSTPN